MIPKEVMLQAQQEFLNFNETGISVMEMSHRSKEYLPIVEKAEKSLRTLLKIPNNYKVLFLQGGAITQNFDPAVCKIPFLQNCTDLRGIRPASRG